MRAMLLARANECRFIGGLIDQAAAYYLTPLQAAIKFLYEAGFTPNHISLITGIARPKVYYNITTILKLKSPGKVMLIAQCHNSKCPGRQCTRPKNLFIATYNYCPYCGRHLKASESNRILYAATGEEIGPRHPTKALQTKALYGATTG